MNDDDDVDVFETIVRNIENDEHYIAIMMSQKSVPRLLSDRRELKYSSTLTEKKFWQLGNLPKRGWGNHAPNHAPCPNHAPTLPQIIRVFAPTMPQPCPNHASVDYQITEIFAENCQSLKTDTENNKRLGSSPYSTKVDTQHYRCYVMVQNGD